MVKIMGSPEVWLSRIAVVSLALAVMAGLAPPAAAKTEEAIAPSDPHAPSAESGWQAGTCNAEPPEAGAETCSLDTPAQFFEEAAAHPQYGFTQFIVAHNGSNEPGGELKDVHVDLPVGLSVNPQATQQCPLATFELLASACPSGSAVGKSLITGTVPILGLPLGPLEATVYNIEPEEGQPALFGLELAGNEVFLKASVDWEGDYHEGFSIEVPPLVHLEPLFNGLILKNRLTFSGRAGDGTFITTPSTCLGEAFSQSGSTYSTFLLAATAQEEQQAGYQFPAGAEPPLESPIPPGTSPKHCDTIPYEPAIAVDPGTTETDSPAGAKLEVSVPHLKDGGSQDSSDTEEAALSLPLGMGINPSAANGLQTCTDEQFGKGTRNPIECPAASRIGTVEIETPPLPEGSLEGPVFVGRQLSRDPASGEEYRIFVDAESARYGISVRLIGGVRADPQTGQLTTTFREAPQVPFSSVVIHLDGGGRATLTSPATCGPSIADAEMTPWSEVIGALGAGGADGPSGKPPAAPSGQFTLNTLPGGGAPCPKTLAERPFAPRFSATTASTQAGAFTSLGVDVARDPGNQELKAADIELPPGMTAKLAGVRYCPEAAIAAAAANSGAAEAASSSCPPESLLGAAAVTLGSGPEPLQIDTGKAFLAGPYQGAPLSLVVITPATAGPFDLGTVVVRVALQVDPRSARVSALTDPIPHVYGGSLLDVREVRVQIDRPEFALNGTNCSPFAFEGDLRGGGANPADPASFTTVPVNSPYQLSGCQNLSFAPRLYLRTFGGLKRAKKPKLRAILVARPGDANVARAQVTLPKALILEQANIGAVCTRVQFAARECPPDSAYGFAEATTPLLDGPLKGPVYLRSNPEHELPDLVAALHGQVDVELSGVTDTTRNGRLRNTFEMIPDVPVSKFTLTVRGGKRGLLVSTRNLCRHRLFSRVELNAQNGARSLSKRQPVRTSCKRRRRPDRSQHPR